MKFGTAVGFDHFPSRFSQRNGKAPSVHAAQRPFDEIPGFQAVQNTGEAGWGEFQFLGQGAGFEDSFVYCTQEQCIIE